MAGEAIIDLLVKSGVLDDRQHDVVLSRAKGAGGGHIVQEIAELGYATESTVARVLSVELGLPRIDLHATPAEPDALELLDAKLCIERWVLPVALREGGELLWLAMGDPTDSATMAQVRRQTGKRVRPVVAGPTEIVREARRIYAVPQPGVSEQSFGREGGIEIRDGGGEERFEMVSLADESADPMSAGGASGFDAAVAGAAQVVQDEQQAMPPPPPTPEELEQLAQAELQDLLRIPAKSGVTAQNDLTAEDIASLEAVRASMEKGALVLRALAELCVDKGLFTKEEMGKKSRTDSARGKSQPAMPTK